MAFNIKQLLQNVKARNLLLGVIIFFVFVFVIGLFFSKKTPSKVGGEIAMPQTPSSSATVVKTSNVSQDYLKLIEKSNREEAERALKTGKSSIPMIVEGERPTSAAAASTTTPVTKLTVEEERKAKEKAAAEATSKPDSKPAEPAINVLLAQMKNNGEIRSVDEATFKRLISTQAPAVSITAELTRLVKDNKMPVESAKKILVNYIDDKVAQSAKTTETELGKMDYKNEMDELEKERVFLDTIVQEREREREAARQQQEQSMSQEVSGTMGAQARSLLAAWSNPSVQTYQSVLPTEDNKGKNAAEGANASQEAVLIKAGTILFAILDTEANSDRPGPIMATITMGKYKGAKLLGTLTRSSDGERVTLDFNLMSAPQLPDAVRISAVAVNPDTSQTAIASSVDHHYLMRYGALLSSSFLAGYARAVENSGKFTLVTATGSSSQTSQYNPGDKFMIGVGEIGRQLSQAAREKFNQPPTVVVNAGVGIGVLFMQSVTPSNPNSPEEKISKLGGGSIVKSIEAIGEKIKK